MGLSDAMKGGRPAMEDTGSSSATCPLSGAPIAMNEEALASLVGRVAALEAVIAAIIETSPRLHQQQIAAQIEREIEASKTQMLHRPVSELTLDALTVHGSRFVQRYS